LRVFLDVLSAFFERDDVIADHVRERNHAATMRAAWVFGPKFQTESLKFTPANTRSRIRMIPVLSAYVGSTAYLVTHTTGTQGCGGHVLLQSKPIT
jgi:hypothetical protein